MLTEDHKRQRVMASRDFFERYAQEVEDLLLLYCHGRRDVGLSLRARNNETVRRVATFQFTEGTQSAREIYGHGTLRPERCFAGIAFFWNISTRPPP